MDRRRFLWLSAAGAGLLAGCGGQQDQQTTATRTHTRTQTGTDASDTTTATETSTPSQSSLPLEWTQLPGPPAGPVTDVGVSPADPSYLYVSTMTAGLYASRDGGQTWRQGPESEHHGRRMTANPHDPTEARRPGNRTVDGGRTWFTGSYQADRLNLPEPERGRVHHIVFDPTEQGILYVGAADGLYRTTDGGRTWSQVSIDVDTASPRITSIDTASGAEGVVYAGYYADSTIVRSTDYGQTWEVVRAPEQAPTERLRGLVATSDGSRAYLCVDRAGLVMVDDSTTRTVAPDATNPYPLFYDGPTIAADDERVYFHAFTLDQGESSSAMWESIQLYEYDTTAEQTRTVDVPEPQASITAHPTNPETLYFGGWSWLWRSDDRGQTWTALDTGFVDRYLSTVGVNPDQPGTIFPGSICSSGLWVSQDAGESFDWKRSGLQPYHQGEFGEHYILDVAAGGSRAYATSGAGLLLSADNGESWRLLNTEFSGRGSAGEPSTPHAGLAIHPNDPKTVYVGSALEGPGPVGNATFDAAHVWRSTDGGATWRDITSGPLTGLRTVVHDLLVSRHDPAVVYAGTLGGNKRHPGGYRAKNATSEGLFRSPDGGETWTRLSTPFDAVYTLTEDATTAGGIYASVVDGVYRSEDGGTTWTEVLSAPTRGLVAHPEQGGLVFAGVQKYDSYWDLLVSRDGGDSWVEGTLTIQVGTGPDTRDYDGRDPNADYKRNNGHIMDLAVDTERSELLAATRGSGLWRGQLDQLLASTE